MASAAKPRTIGKTLSHHNPNDDTRHQEPPQHLKAVSEIPSFDAVELQTAAEHDDVNGFIGIRRLDTRQVVAVHTDRYQLVQHRAVAEKALAAVKAVRTADNEDLKEVLAALDGTGYEYPTERLTLYDRGRAMEYRAVINQKHAATKGEEFFPAIRVVNSVSGKLALRVSGFALHRAHLTEHFVPGNVMEFRELHLESEVDLTTLVNKGVAGFLDHFPDAMRVYDEMLGDKALIPLAGLADKLTEGGVPARHSEEIVRRLIAKHPGAPTAGLRRWPCYQEAAAYLTHFVKVTPAREEFLAKRAAAVFLNWGGVPKGAA